MKIEKKKFIRTSIVFMSLVALLILLMNSAYIFYAQKTWNFYRIQREYAEILDEPDLHIEYAFFGDSHAEQSMDQQYYPDSFNFAVSSENYVETYYKFRNILADGVKIDNIVLEIDLHTFSKPRERLFILPMISSKSVPLRDMALLKNESIISLAIKAYLPVFGIGLRLIDFIEPKSDDFSQQDMKYETRKVFEGHFEKGKLAFEEPNYSYFLRLLELAKKNNVSVILIKYPLTKVYDQMVVEHGFSKEDYYRTIYADADRILGNYKVLDYYSVFFDRPEYFYDPHHINSRGKKLMAEYFYRDIQS